MKTMALSVDKVLALICDDSGDESDVPEDPDFPLPTLEAYELEDESPPPSPHNLSDSFRGCTVGEETEQEELPGN